MQTTIKRQLMLPFAAGLAALATAIGIGSVLATRGAANDELTARSVRADKLSRDTIDQTRRQLSGDALLLGRLLVSGSEQPTALENRIVRFSVERDLSHVSLVDARGKTVGGDGRAQWTNLALTKRLRRRAARTGTPVVTTGVSDRGEPLILAAAHVRGESGERTVVLGRAIDRSLLAPVERSLGVLLQVEARAAAGKMPARRGSLQPEGTRTFTRPLKLSEPGTEARLLVSTSSRRLSAATWSILMVTGGAGVLILMLLLGFLQLLLGRSVVSPVRKLAGGLDRVREGQHETRVSVDGAQELRSLAEGFNEMTATVGAQHRRLEHLAATDHLTGLANHRRFHDSLGPALAQAERDGQPLALVALDLDHFKALNDTHGHAFGDRALRLAGARLREAVRESDLVGRVGGEEFALMLPATGATEAMEVAERARTAVEAVELEGATLGCSAGFAVFPDDTVGARELLAFADAALYAAKSRGRGQTQRFDARHVTTLSPEQQRRAVNNLLAEPERVTPAFQPIVSLGDGVGGGLRGARALRRLLRAHPARVVHARSPVRPWHRAPGAGGRSRACGARPPGGHLPVREPGPLRTRDGRLRGGPAQRPSRDRHRDHRAGADLRPRPPFHRAGAPARPWRADCAR